MMERTRSGGAQVALRSRAMRQKAHRASLIIGLALALLASRAHALDSPDEEPVLEEQPVASYAHTPVRDGHDPRNAAHPLRIVAYALHPVGVALDWVVVRPAVWVVRHEPFRTIFGFED